MLDCSQEAVRTRLHRARRELKERLRPYLENWEKTGARKQVTS